MAWRWHGNAWVVLEHRGTGIPIRLWTSRWTATGSSVVTCASRSSSPPSRQASALFEPLSRHALERKADPFTGSCLFCFRKRNGESRPGESIVHPRRQEASTAIPNFGLYPADDAEAVSLDLSSMSRDDRQSERHRGHRARGLTIDGRTGRAERSTRRFRQIDYSRRPASW